MAIVESITSTSQFTCSHCDVETVDKLANQMLRAIAARAYLRHGDHPLTAPEVNNLKTKLLLEVLHLNSDQVMGLSAVFEAIERLETGADRSTLHQMVTSKAPEDKIESREDYLNAHDFTLEERLELAKLIIRKHDSEHSAHCAQQNCGEECDFAPAHCSHEGNSTRVLWSYCTSENLLYYKMMMIGCSQTMSRKWKKRHEDECEFRIVPCPRQCGEDVAKKDMENHIKFACSYRPVPCPYVDLGCTAGKYTFLY